MTYRRLRISTEPTPATRHFLALQAQRSHHAAGCANPGCDLCRVWSDEVRIAALRLMKA